MHLLGTTLANLDNVAAVSVNEDFLARFSSMMKSMDLIVLVIIICAAGLAFIVLYNLTNINITERVRGRSQRSRYWDFLKMRPLPMCSGKTCF